MPVIDKAELILLRIVAVLATIDGLATEGKCYRDRADFPDELCPAVVVLDGAETRITGLERGQNRRPPAPGVYELTPEIFIILRPRDDSDNAGIGEELSLFRRRCLDALFNDDQLWALLGDNGRIEYRGRVTDMQSGNEMKGQQMLNVAFQYMLDVTDLFE